MKAFQYKTVTLNSLMTSLDMNELGAVGWELVNMIVTEIPDPLRWYIKHKHIYIFKRQIAEE